MSAPTQRVITPADCALLHAAATCLDRLDLDRDADLVARIASTDHRWWDEGMAVRAAVAVNRHRDRLVASGFDPLLIPEPPHSQTARHAHPNTPEKQGDTTGPDWDEVFSHAAQTETHNQAVEGTAHDGPFDYEHTIVGLQGITVDELGTVTERNAAGFAAAGLHSAFDVLMHVPLRYIDRSTRTMIRDIVPNTDVTILATVKHTRKERLAPKGNQKRGMPIAKITVEDATGTLNITHFNAAWQADRFKAGDEVIVQGKATIWQGDTRSFTSMANPLMDRAGDQAAPILPVYPQLGTSQTKEQRKQDGTGRAVLTTWMVHKAVTEIVDRMGELSDPIPTPLLTQRDLMPRQDAFVQVHTPNTVGAEQPARDRLAYDELLRMQLALGMRRHHAATQTAVTHQPTGALTTQVFRRLPFSLTGAQQRALREIRADMSTPQPMHRLLQGDVGAGKSLVATGTLLMGLEGGYQGALMAPTAILARQLYAEIRDLTDGLTHPDGRPLRIEYIPNRQKTRARRDVDAGLRDGTVDILVGTHALIEDDVTFNNLGVVVIDEQHRFGVEQRAKLRAKGPEGATPDLLAMTATPIPRTSAMTVFGDLVLSVLDELPPGRTPIVTDWVGDEPEYDNPHSSVWGPIRQAVQEGRQAYVVCPLVEDSETKAAAAAEQVKVALESGALKGLRVGVVHGKQKDLERESTMRTYKSGDIDVLVATTVIEVGVSVPNATRIVILEPKKFGIAQLHQLRGRVGRGQHAGACTLYGKVTSDDGVARMDAICSTTDGFVLADLDLQIRGAGQVLGSAQSGLSDLKVASLATDETLISAAREDATTLLEHDPKLGKRPALRAEVMAALGPDGAEWLARS